MWKKKREKKEGKKKRNSGLPGLRLCWRDPKVRVLACRALVVRLLCADLELAIHRHARFPPPGHRAVRAHRNLRMHLLDHSDPLRVDNSGRDPGPAHRTMPSTLFTVLSKGARGQPGRHCCVWWWFTVVVFTVGVYGGSGAGGRRHGGGCLTPRLGRSLSHNDWGTTTRGIEPATPNHGSKAEYC